MSGKSKVQKKIEVVLKKLRYRKFGVDAGMSIDIYLTYPVRPGQAKTVAGALKATGLATGKVLKQWQYNVISLEAANV